MPQHLSVEFTRAWPKHTTHGLLGQMTLIKIGTSCVITIPSLVCYIYFICHHYTHTHASRIMLVDFRPVLTYLHGIDQPCCTLYTQSDDLK